MIDTHPTKITTKNHKVWILQMKQKQKLEMRCPLSILSRLSHCPGMIAVMKTRECNYFLLLYSFCWLVCRVVFSVFGIKWELRIPECLSGKAVSHHRKEVQITDRGVSKFFFPHGAFGRKLVQAADRGSSRSQSLSIKISNLVTLQV